jgi:hypothetical protein
MRRCSIRGAARPVRLSSYATPEQTRHLVLVYRPQQRGFGLGSAVAAHMLDLLLVDLAMGVLPRPALQEPLGRLLDAGVPERMLRQAITIRVPRTPHRPAPTRDHATPPTVINQTQTPAFQFL